MKFVLFLLALCFSLHAEDFIVDSPISTTQVTATHVVAGGISATAVSATGNISAAKFVGDGSLLTGIAGGTSSPSWYAIQSIPTGVSTISNTGLVTGELQQLQNIDTVTINNTSWGYVGALNQSVSTTASVLFATVSATASNAADMSATRALVGGLVEGIVSQTATTGTTYVNVRNAGMAYLSASSNTVVSITGGVPGKSVMIVVKQDGTGGRRVDFATPTHHWNNALSTTQITSGSSVSQWSWATPDGVNWFGGLIGSGM